MSKWIVVEQKLPNKHGEYLVYIPFVGIRILHHDIYNNSWTDVCSDTFHPTHWMKLPSEPEVVS